MQLRFGFCSICILFDSALRIGAGFQDRTVQFHPLTNPLCDTLCSRWKNVNLVSIKHYSTAVIFTTAQSLQGRLASSLPFCAAGGLQFESFPGRTGGGSDAQH